MNQPIELFNENDTNYASQARSKPFSIFCQLNKNKYKLKYAKCTPTQITNILAQMWSDMDQKSRQPYADIAAQMYEHDLQKVSKNRDLKTAQKTKSKAKRHAHVKDGDEFAQQQHQGANSRHERQYKCPAPIIVDDGERHDRFQAEERARRLMRSIENCLALSERSAAFDPFWYSYIPMRQNMRRDE